MWLFLRKPTGTLVTITIHEQNSVDATLLRWQQTWIVLLCHCCHKDFGKVIFNLPVAQCTCTCMWNLYLIFFEDYTKNDLGLWICITLQCIYHSFYGYNCWIYIAFMWIFMSANGPRKSLWQQWHNSTIQVCCHLSKVASTEFCWWIVIMTKLPVGFP